MTGPTFHCRTRRYYFELNTRMRKEYEQRLEELKKSAEEEVDERLDASVKRILAQNRRMAEELKIHVQVRHQGWGWARWVGPLGSLEGVVWGGAGATASYGCVRAGARTTVVGAVSAPMGVVTERGASRFRSFVDVHMLVKGMHLCVVFMCPAGDGGAAGGGAGA